MLSGNEKSSMFKTPQKRGIGFQGFRPNDVTHSFTKCTVTADNPLAVKCALDSLYKLALDHRQGPVWLDVPQDIAAMVAA
jgi:thiamine pyrophosphate-dependent acetolactate synthase large subunit-like protein